MSFLYGALEVTPAAARSPKMASEPHQLVVQRSRILPAVKIGVTRRHPIGVSYTRSIVNVG